jgi:hypothetical protein
MYWAINNRVWNGDKLPRHHFVDPSCRVPRHDNGTKLSGFRVSRVSKNTSFFRWALPSYNAHSTNSTEQNQGGEEKMKGLVGIPTSKQRPKAKGQAWLGDTVLRSQGQTGEMQEGERSAPDLGRSVYKVAHCILEDGSTAKGWVFSPLRRATRRLRPAIERPKPKAQSPKPKPRPLTCSLIIIQ